MKETQGMTPRPPGEGALVWETACLDSGWGSVGWSWVDHSLFWASDLLPQKNEGLERAYPAPRCYIGRKTYKENIKEMLNQDQACEVGSVWEKPFG